MSGVLSVLDQLKIAARNGEILDASQLERMLGPKEAAETSYTELIPDSPVFRNRFGISVSAKTPAQAELVKAVEKNDIIFAKGPAGTGKTFLAVTLAVASLERGEAERICLVRPAVEAGESLGYLPGDLKEKIAPPTSARSTTAYPNSVPSEPELNTITALSSIERCFTKRRRINQLGIIMQSTRNAAIFTFGISFIMSSA